MRASLRSRSFFIILALFCLLSLTFAFIAEIFFDILPCKLCTYQRFILFFMVISSIAAIKLKFFKYISYLLIASSFSLNTFQIAVEQKWIQPPDSCKQKVIPMYKLKNMSIDEKQKALKQMHVVPCDVIAWKFLGISMTIWFELAIVLIIVCKFLIILT